MLACMLRGRDNVVLENVPIPSVTDGEVLVRMKACGICGTDLEKISGELDPNGILGHEPSGIVEAIGDNVRDVQLGDRVVVHHHVPCYSCKTCIGGDYTMCVEFKQANIDPCGVAEFFRVPGFNVSRGALIKIPDKVDFEEGAMIEPAACCIRAIRKASIRPTDSVVILGLGPTGLTQVQLVRRITHGNIIGIDIIENRLKAGLTFGLDEAINPTSQDAAASIRRTTGGGADVAVVSTGNPNAFSSAISIVRKGGRILLFGAPGRGSSINLDLSTIFSNQIQILTSYSCLESEMQEAIQLVLSKRLSLKELITNRFALQEAVQAFKSARTSQASLKTIIVT
jgi:L-iditol 2-dehydrogenase